MTKRKTTSPKSASKSSKSTRAPSSKRPRVVVMPPVFPERARRNPPEAASSVGAAAFDDLLGPGGRSSASGQRSPAASSLGGTSSRPASLQDWDTPYPDGRPHPYPVRPRSSAEYRQPGLPMRTAEPSAPSGGMAPTSGPGGRMSALQERAVSHGAGAATSLRDALSEYERGVLEGYEIGLSECGPLSGFTNFFRRRRKLKEFARRRQEEIHQAAVAAASLIQETQQRERAQAARAVGSHGSPAESNPMPAIPRPWRTLGAWRSLTDGDTVQTASEIVMRLAREARIIQDKGKLSLAKSIKKDPLTRAMIALHIIDLITGIFAATQRPLSADLRWVMAKSASLVLKQRCVAVKGELGDIAVARLESLRGVVDAKEMISAIEESVRGMNKDKHPAELDCEESIGLLLSYVASCYAVRVMAALAYLTATPIPVDGKVSMILWRTVINGMLCQIATNEKTEGKAKR